MNFKYNEQHKIVVEHRNKVITMNQILLFSSISVALIFIFKGYWFSVLLVFATGYILSIIYSVIVSNRVKNITGLSQAEQAEIPTYIELDGDLGIISDGAGTGMLTLDLTKERGLRAGVYCELGGKATPTLIEEALRIISSNQGIKIILVNLIGGLNRMDEMAQGITGYLINHGKKRSDVKIVVRMSGTLETEGRQTLEHSGISSFDNIYDAIDSCSKNSEAV